MLYKIINGSVSYGADTVLENIDFEVKDKEKVAVVGRNGCGKSTLLKAITGEVVPEEGTGEETFNIIKSGNPVIGYLKQATFPDGSVTMTEEILKVFKPVTDTEEKMNAMLKTLETDYSEKNIKAYANLQEKYEFLGGYTYKKEYLTAIKKFGFSDEDKQKRLSEFSGGQLTKIAFIKLLLSKPDILLLDEPTNHLDITTIEWLEDYLKNYKSAVVIVSHDRMFLDKIVGTVYEIEYGETKRYSGSYSDFEKQKKDAYQKQLKDHDMQRAEIERLTKLIERFRYKATKAKMVQSKIKQIEHMKKIDKPNRYDLKTFHADFQPDVESSKQVLTVKGLDIGYKTPLAKVDFELIKGQKLGIIGGNGIGKSTLLKTLVGNIPSLGGTFSFGTNVRIGYFDQQMAQFRSEKTVYDEFHDTFPSMTETDARKALGAFLFSGEDVFKQVNSLSGGEKVRLALCKILKRKPNLLILDEPTNHMDIVGKETLENMLKEYAGTLIFVSHDRYFVNKIADRLLVFENGNADFYSLTFSEYENYLKEKNAETEQNGVSETKTEEKPTVKKGFTSPLKEKAKKEKRAAKLEKLIEENDRRAAELKEELTKPEIYSDYTKVSEIQKELDEIAATQNEYTEEWAAISDELEQFQ